MTLEFELPDTGEGVTEGQFLEWLVEEGDEVEEDQAIAEVETDKAVVDVPAPADGVVNELKVEPGDTVDVGEVIMIMDVEGDSSETDAEEESVEQAEVEDGKDDAKDEKDVAAEEDGSNDVSDTSSSTSTRGVLALPKVRKLAEEKGVDLASIKTGERITEQEVLDAAGGAGAKTITEEQSEERKSVEDSETGQTGQEASTNNTDSGEVLATPAVRKLAREKEIDITKVEGSGRGGKVTRDDVLQFAESGGKPETGRTVKTESSDERVELSNIRQTIAERMTESRFTAPHVTHIEKADVEKLFQLREQKKEDVETHLTYLPFIMKAAYLALQEHPDLNAELDEENNEIIRYGSYDFNMAVDTDHGLMVPKIDDVDGKSIIELAEDIVEKAERAHEGDLSSEEMENGTFSITNVGVIGGESFTPIINYPQVAILGLGRISETAEVVDGEVVPRHTLKLSLSYDHRVVDGAEAARFMNKLVENLEDPEKMLIGL